VGLRAGRVVLDIATEGLSRDQVMEIYGRVATTTTELQVIEQELSEVRDAILAEEAQLTQDENR